MISNRAFLNSITGTKQGESQTDCADPEHCRSAAIPAGPVVRCGRSMVSTAFSGAWGFWKNLTASESLVWRRVSSRLRCGWTTRISLRLVDETCYARVTPHEVVAEAMLALVKDGAISSNVGGDGQEIQMKGGTVIEVLAGSIRDVPLFNNEGPLTGDTPGAKFQ